jgi:hypothetical protein
LGHQAWPGRIIIWGDGSRRGRPKSSEQNSPSRRRCADLMVGLSKSSNLAWPERPRTWQVPPGSVVGTSLWLASPTVWHSVFHEVHNGWGWRLVAVAPHHQRSSRTLNSRTACHACLASRQMQASTTAFPFPRFCFCSRFDVRCDGTASPALDRFKNAGRESSKYCPFSAGLGDSHPPSPRYAMVAAA